MIRSIFQDNIYCLYPICCLQTKRESLALSKEIKTLSLSLRAFQTLLTAAGLRPPEASAGRGGEIRVGDKGNKSTNSSLLNNDAEHIPIEQSSDQQKIILMRTTYDLTEKVVLARSYPKATSRTQSYPFSFLCLHQNNFGYFVTYWNYQNKKFMSGLFFPLPLCSDLL